MKSLNRHYREMFGSKVYKLALDAGFTCPNRDGTLGYGGCIFCSGSGSGDFAEGPRDSLARQLEEAKKRVAHKNPGGKYIAYFQAFTGTYAPADKLERLYREALEQPDVVGIAIGTRPDCLGPEVLALLARLSRETYVSVELGLQTIHSESIRFIRRGYENGVYDRAVRELKAAGVEVVTHIILGLPGETREMMLQTTRHALQAGTDGIKFHLLHVLAGTDLHREYLEGRCPVMTLEEYASALKTCIDALPESTVVHRITGDGAKKDLVAPAWSADKKRVLNYLHSVLDNSSP